ncbi:Long-chain-fatty-acid-CoA ligase [Spraguea lophii 42_110]|uniref:Long-chain-fatty-acid-CoA ligase n=1 Tax=Spraguea lophii (strain 42_110) TaxID=1358809 RepID=S7XFF5_SPRLO|nr:Long-chain-fatty-acid-CoA ligase [Spraguea lophii 42_110]
MKIRHEFMIEEDGVYRHPEYDEDILCTKDGSQTLHELFINIVKRRPNNEFLGRIINDKVEYLTFQETYYQTVKLAAFLKLLIPEKQIITLFTRNRPEWIITEQASYMNNSIICPLYSTLGIVALEHIIDEVESKICFVSEQNAKNLYEMVLSKKETSVTDIISYDCLEDSLISEYNEKGINVHHYDDIMECETYLDIMKLMCKNREENIEDFRTKDNNDDEKIIKDENIKNIQFTSELKGSDISTICYTSGTTGLPKGGMLTHKNFIVTSASFFKGTNGDPLLKIDESTVYISYLPLAHVMERVSLITVLSVGCKIGFFRGNPKLIQQDFQIIKPKFLIGVPRIFNVFKEKIIEKVKERGFFVYLIFIMALKYKIWRQKYGSYSSPFLDKFIFSKVAKEFGGKLEAGLSGGAPLNPEVCEFLQAVFSFQLTEGYGQTEATAANMTKPREANVCGTVGVPFPSVLVKLDTSIEHGHPQMGEILLKGKALFKGYYKDEQKTKDAYTEDGWLRTGDIGEVKHGLFYIIGRKKDSFKTSLGEYITPERLEDLYKQSNIHDILITGNKYCDYIVAIVICLDESISKDEIIKKITDYGLELVKDNKIMKFEIPKKIHVLRKPFDEYGEFVTPTGKKKRVQVESYFKSIIDNLYEK